MFEFDYLSNLHVGAVRQSFYDNSVVFEGYLFTNYFPSVSLREYRVFLEVYITTPVRSSLKSTSLYRLAVERVRTSVLFPISTMLTKVHIFLEF